MFLLIPVFFALSLAVAYSRTARWRETRAPYALILALCATGIPLLVLPQLWSLGRAFRAETIAASWAVLVVGLAIGFRRDISDGATMLVSDGLRYARDLGAPGAERLPRVAILAVCGLFALGTGVATLAYPVTDGDSMQFHMERVFFWVQNQTVAHFPASAAQGLSTYPFASYVTAQLKLLSGGSDALAGTVEWFAYVMCALLVAAVARRLTKSGLAPYLSALFAMTIPAAVLQASSGMYDLPAATWALAAAYVTVDLIDSEGMAGRDYYFRLALLGTLFSLGINAKITVPIVFVSFLVWLAIAVWAKYGWRRTLASLALAVSIAAVLSAGLTARNLSFGTGDALGIKIPGNAHILVPDRSLGALWTNAVRNVGNELATPVGSLNAVSVRVLARIAGLGGVPIDSPTNMEDPRPYSLSSQANLHNTFGSAPVTLLAYAVVYAILALALMKGRLSRGRGWYALAALVGYLTLSTIITWQPFSVRTMVTPLLVMAPTVAIAWSATSSEVQGRGRSFGRIGISTVAVIAVVFALLPLLFNRTNPLVSDRVLGLPKPWAIGFWDAPRSELEYLQTLPWYGELIEVARRVGAEYEPQSVVITGIAPEGIPYPLVNAFPDATRVGLDGSIVTPASRRFLGRFRVTNPDVLVILDTERAGEEARTYHGRRYRQVFSDTIVYPDYSETPRLFGTIYVAEELPE